MQGFEQLLGLFAAAVILAAAARRIAAPCSSDEIGDDAFHRVEEELNWLEIGRSHYGLLGNPAPGQPCRRRTGARNDRHIPIARVR
jgi:hypothetical protein